MYVCTYSVHVRDDDYAMRQCGLKLAAAWARRGGVHGCRGLGTRRRGMLTRCQSAGVWAYFRSGGGGGTDPRATLATAIV